MSTVVKTIKNYLTDDTIYPITKASAVYMANSTIDTVESKLTELDNNKLDKINPTIIDSTLAILSSTVLSGASGEYKGTYIHYRDKNDLPIAQIAMFQNANGDQGVRLLGYQGNPTLSTPTSTYHGVSIGTKKNGEPYFTVNGNGTMKGAIQLGLDLNTIIKKLQVNVSVSIPANGITLGALTDPINGYECMAARFNDSTSSPSSSVFPCGLMYQSSKYRVRLRNLATAAKSVTGTVTFYFVKTDFANG